MRMKRSLSIQTWISVVDLAKKYQQQEKRRKKNLSVRFADHLNQVKQFDPDYATRSITEPGLKGEEHYETPWYEQDYEDIPWWEMPDIDEDDELTCLCKKVVAAGDYDKNTNDTVKEADRVQSIVLKFALKLQNKCTKRKPIGEVYKTLGGTKISRSATNIPIANIMLEESIESKIMSKQRPSPIDIRKKTPSMENKEKLMRSSSNYNVVRSTTTRRTRNTRKNNYHGSISSQQAGRLSKGSIRTRISLWESRIQQKTIVATTA